MKETRTRREAGLALRALMALVVWLAVAGHVSGLAHFVLISHHVCADHGELAHGDDGGHLHATLSTGAATDGASSIAPTAGEVDEHEHCSVLARRQEHATAAREAAALPLPLVTPRSGDTRPDSLPHRGEALLTLAPKTSPPV